MAFDNIPAEMRDYKSWCVWKSEQSESGRLTKIPYSPLTGRRIDPTDSNDFVTFEDAIKAATNWSGIGFVLSDADPYAFIDLDEPKNPDGSALDPDEYANRVAIQHSIFNNFPSYSELSPSGKGLHIILKGEVPAGRKRDSVEIYSNLRFMTMTGNVYRDAPIQYYNGELLALWQEMTPPNRDPNLYYAGLEKETISDDEVIRYASTASNGALFNRLFFNADITGYPGQSEADFALIDIIAFYSRNRTQTARIFQNSIFGKRDKYKGHKKLLGYMLDRCFDHLPPPIDIQTIANNILAAHEAKQAAEAAASKAIIVDPEKDWLNQGPPALFIEDNSTPFSPPPGLLGEIAQFLYSYSYRPVAEIALAGAIGFMAGLCGKAYNTPTGTGLNLYVLLLAMTGTGKESMAKGIQRLVKEIDNRNKIMSVAGDFIGPSNIASPQALTKFLAKKPSVVSIIGEFAIYYKNMTSVRASSHDTGLMRLLLDLYNKSGYGQSVGSHIYSDADKNTQVVQAPAFSILAESVPETFYESLNETMIISGLLPRFLIIDYKGEDVAPNKAAATVVPTEDLITKLQTLMNVVMTSNKNGAVTYVEQSDEGRKLLDDFELYADGKKRGQREVVKGLWTRAYMKAIRLASVVAIGINSYHPVIDEVCANWAIRLVSHDVEQMVKKFENGEVGENTHEEGQLNSVVRLINRFIKEPWDKIAKTTGTKLQPLHAAKLVPYTFLQKSTAAYPMFKNDKIGATQALKRAVRTLCERGDLQPVPKQDMAKYGTSCDAYAITNADAIMANDKK